MPERGKTNRMATARKCFYFNWRGKTDRANTVSFSPVLLHREREQTIFSIESGIKEQRRTHASESIVSSKSSILFWVSNRRETRKRNGEGKRCISVPLMIACTPTCRPQLLPQVDEPRVRPDHFVTGYPIYS